MNPVEYIKICFRKYADFSGRPIRPMRCPLRGRIGRNGFAAFGQCVAPYGGALAAAGRTGWWLLLALIPFVGWIPLLIMAVLPGTGGPNRYGSVPLPSPRGTGGYSPTTGAPYAPLPPPDAYGASGASAPPPYTPGGRQYCTQCGAERTAGDARFCTVCGAAF